MSSHDSSYYRNHPVLSVSKYFFLLIVILGIAQLPSQAGAARAEAKAQNIQDESPAVIPTTPSPGGETEPGETDTGTSDTGETIYLPLSINNFFGYAASPSDDFHYGVLEAAGFVGNPVDFETYIQDWKSHGFDAALVINHIPDLTVSDRLDFKIVASPLGDLYEQWFYYEESHNGASLCGGDITIECAREIIGPIVDPLKIHPSVIGYYIFDDATAAEKERIRLATQVFKEHDPLHPASPGLLELGQGQTVYEHARPEAFVTYDYPVLNAYPACDFYKGGYRDWVDRTRETIQARPESVPFWAILQAHGSEDNFLGLRTPKVEEARLLNWLALGEDAKGIFWFTWSTHTEQFWTGIQDNPALLAEVTDLARRVNALRPYLSMIRKISDQFQVSSGNGYASTLKDFSTGKLYVIAANPSCSPQDLSLSSWYYQAKLKDLETGELIELGTPLSFRGGDGRLYEVVDAVPLPSPAPQANLASNPSFELDTDQDGVPDLWGPADSTVRDTTTRHSGVASIKITGASIYSLSQVVPLKPDTKYYLSWYVKAQDLVESHLAIRYVQTTPSQVNLDFVMWNQNGSYDWVKRVGFFKTPEDFQTGKIIIAWDVKSGSTFWVDDLVLCESSQPCTDAYLKERE